MSGKVEVYAVFRQSGSEGVKYVCRPERNGTWHCGGCGRGVIRNRKQTHCRVCGRHIVFEYTFRPNLPR